MITKHRSASLLAFSLCMLLTWVMSARPLRAQDVSVTSATPNAAAQGTVSLDVTIGGSGFKKGAKAQWFITGTTNPGGITVNSTTFVNATTLVANITVAADAQTQYKFDIAVASGGRTGKGIELFSVTSNGNKTCTTLGTPNGFTLVTTLNYVNSSGATQYQPHLGTAIDIREVTITNGVASRTVDLAAVGTGTGNGKLEVFLIDPATGQVLDGQSILGGPVQPHITVVPDPALTGALTVVAGGDLNGDGIPDFAVNINQSSETAVVVGRMDANGILSYGSPMILNPGSPSAVAMGNLNSDPGDELVIGTYGSSKGHVTTSAAVRIYKYNGSGFSLIQTVTESSGIGGGLAIADVTGDGAPDLLVAVDGATVGGVSGSGVVYVYPSVLTSTFGFSLSSGVADDALGWQLGAGPLTTNTATDVIATTRYDVTTTNTNMRALVFSGPITGDRTSSSFDFLPYPGLANGWATSFAAGDMTGDGRAEVLVGAPTTTGGGAAHLYLSNPSNPAQPTLTIFQAPTCTVGYGHSLGLVPYSAGNPSLLLVGANSADVGSVTAAGQVFVYKKD